MRNARIAWLAAAGLLAGCGQTGPLYLPEPAGEVVTRPAQTPTEAPTTPAPVEPKPEGTESDNTPPTP
jgi:predicted small lipoprotein YifL